MAQRSGVEQRVVEVRGGDEARSLSVATSYLRHAGGGPSKAVAVVAVFSDITELRETELRMAKAVEEQHRRLQDAYREIETRNEALAAALRKVRVGKRSSVSVMNVPPAGSVLAARVRRWG